MLIFRFIILYWVITRICLHALRLKKYVGFLVLSSAAAPYPPLCLKLSRHFKAPPS